MTAFFVLGYAAPFLGTACLLATLATQRRRLALPARVALSVGMASSGLWASLAASDLLQASSLGVGVVAYFLPGPWLGLGAVAWAAGAASPKARGRLSWPWAWAMALGVALAVAPFALGKAAMERDAAALPARTPQP